MICSPVIPVPVDVGAGISARAASHIGAPFRLHGRSAVGGFDCVGLAADALSHSCFNAPISSDYTLRGQFEQRIRSFFADPAFVQVSACKPGDFLLVCPAPQQVHMMIVADGGFIHAHAGLRRVVLTPAPSPWPVIGHWRFIGE